MLWWCWDVWSLIGWALQIELLKVVVPGLVSMKANTALSLVLAGASLWLLLPGGSGPLRKATGQGLALLVALIGAASLSEYMFAHDLGIDQLLFLKVLDSGCGIDTETSKTIFDRLYQVEDSTQASRKGLGLGLFICKELVTRQGGRISVKSKLGNGSMFSFTVPVVSVKNLISTLFTHGEWPGDSVALVVVEMDSLSAKQYKDYRQERTREVRNLIQSCSRRGFDLLLPDMGTCAQKELFFLVAFADEQGASALAGRIRGQFENGSHFKEFGSVRFLHYAGTVWAKCGYVRRNDRDQHDHKYRGIDPIPVLLGGHGLRVSISRTA